MVLPILDNVVAWTQQGTKVNVAATVGGGWERWAQMDLTLEWKHIANATVDCETQVYDNSGKRCDIFISEPPVYTPNVGMVTYKDFIELKCWNFRTENIQAFSARFKTDCTKLFGYHAAGYTPHPVRKIAIGFLPLAAYSHSQNVAIPNYLTWAANNLPASFQIGTGVNVTPVRRLTNNNVVLVYYEFTEVN